MKKKLLIGAGIVLTIFIVFLIAICGSAGSNNVPTEEELKKVITDVTCEVKDSENINYELSTLSNDISFDSELENQQYTKIIVNKEQDFKSLGVAFIVKSNEEMTLNISLNKNETSLKTISLTLKDGVMESANLLLEEEVAISTTDEFTITFEQTTDCSFTFDTMIFFFGQE